MNVGKFFKLLARVDTKRVNEFIGAKIGETNCFFNHLDILGVDRQAKVRQKTLQQIWTFRYLLERIFTKTIHKVPVWGVGEGGANPAIAGLSGSCKVSPAFLVILLK